MQDTLSPCDEYHHLYSALFCRKQFTGYRQQVGTSAKLDPGIPIALESFHPTSRSYPKAQRRYDIRQPISVELLDPNRQDPRNHSSQRDQRRNYSHDLVLTMITSANHCMEYECAAWENPISSHKQCKPLRKYINFGPNTYNDTLRALSTYTAGGTSKDSREAFLGSLHMNL